RRCRCWGTLRRRGRLLVRHDQRVDPVRRWGRVRLRGRDRDQQPEAACARSDGARRDDLVQIHRARGRTGEGMSTRNDLLQLEEERWNQMCRLLDKIPDWEGEKVCDDWSVKDLLGHVAAWHATTMDRLEQFQSSGKLPPPPEDIDAFNA